MKRCIIITAWSVALALSAFAQNPPLQTITLVLEATIPGTPASGFTVRNQVAARDFNDDGVPDIAMIETSDEMIVIVVVDGTNPENVWQISASDGPPPMETLTLNIVAFIDLDPADGLKAVVLAERQGQRYVNPFVVDHSNNTFSQYLTGGLLAIDNGGAGLTERIVIFNPQVPQVEIWGAENN